MWAIYYHIAAEPLTNRQNYNNRGIFFFFLKLCEYKGQEERTNSENSFDSYLAYNHQYDIWSNPGLTSLESKAVSLHVVPF